MEKKTIVKHIVLRGRMLLLFQYRNHFSIWTSILLFIAYKNVLSKRERRQYHWCKTNVWKISLPSDKSCYRAAVCSDMKYKTDINENDRHCRGIYWRCGGEFVLEDGKRILIMLWALIYMFCICIRITFFWVLPFSVRDLHLNRLQIQVLRFAVEMHLQEWEVISSNAYKYRYQGSHSIYISRSER